MHELHYSPSQLKEILHAPRNEKAFYYASIEIKLEQLAKELKKLEKGGK
ncbi:hypothetical protein B4168_2414 [Anoxybacillus flavithermus]|nr:phage-like element PBSX protein xkdN2 [Parageobacillus thermoglucosidasius TNO-09.020]KYD17853.1 hypothetical protein B4168_2414 [Anoxybacillus flavithermus]OAO85366.1 hypothetical protein GT23_3057 [Parageobacillus thermoglucosidasius]